MHPSGESVSDVLVGRGADFAMAFKGGGPRCLQCRFRDGDAAESRAADRAAETELAAQAVLARIDEAAQHAEPAELFELLRSEVGGVVDQAAEISPEWRRAWARLAQSGVLSNTHEMLSLTGRRSVSLEKINRGVWSESAQRVPLWIAPQSVTRDIGSYDHSDRRVFDSWISASGECWCEWSLVGGCTLLLEYPQPVPVAIAAGAPFETVRSRMFPRREVVGGKNLDPEPLTYRVLGAALGYASGTR